jgi:hypothetical protein
MGMRKVFYQWAGVGILSLIGWGVSMMPKNTSWIPSVTLWAIAGLWFVGTLVYYWWKIWGKKQPEIVKETKGGRLTDILTDMHEQLKHLITIRLKKRFNKKQFNDAIPILFDKLEVVKLNDYEDFKKKIRKRIRRRVPKSPEKLKQTGWYYKVIGVATEIRKELADSREWQIEDVVKVGAWLDSLRIGVGELRNKDETWQGLWEEVKPHMEDDELRGLVDKYLTHSYAFCSFLLYKSYCDRLPQDNFGHLLYAALVGSNISPDKIDIALSEILGEITNRIKQDQLPENWIDAYKAKTGKLPLLPDYLVSLFENYSSGQPVSKAMKVITPSGQKWNSLRLSQQNQWRQVVEWLGEDPEDYLAHMRRMLPRTPSGVDRIRYRPRDQR